MTATCKCEGKISTIYSNIINHFGISILKKNHMCKHLVPAASDLSHRTGNDSSTAKRSARGVTVTGTQR